MQHRHFRSAVHQRLLVLFKKPATEAAFNPCSVLQRRLQPLAAPFSWARLPGPLPLHQRKKMNAGKLIARWWWLLVVLLFSATLLYFIWTSQRQVNALDKELHRPKMSQPNN